MGTTHSSGFRQEAVRAALTSGLTRKQVAADFGVGFSTLSRWIQLDRRNPEKPTAQSDMEREITELRKEVRLLLRGVSVLVRQEFQTTLGDPVKEHLPRQPVFS